MEAKTSLVIPCYNEETGIPQLCERLRPLLDSLGGDGAVEIVFVDDGSTDSTAEVIAREATGLPYRVATHEQNRGLGAALHTGFAASHGEEIVVLDSDCTYDPDQVPGMLEKLRAGADVVTASPYHPQGRVEGVAGWRLLLSKGLSRLYWLVLPQRLYTYTACFRAYRREAIPDLYAPDPGFLGVTQLLVSGILAKKRVVEVPAVLTTRRFGQSKIRVVQVSWAHMRYISRILLRGIPGVSPLRRPTPVSPHEQEGSLR